MECFMTQLGQYAMGKYNIIVVTLLWSGQVIIIPIIFHASEDKQNLVGRKDKYKKTQNQEEKEIWINNKT